MVINHKFIRNLSKPLPVFQFTTFIFLIICCLLLAGCATQPATEPTSSTPNPAPSDPAPATSTPPAAPPLRAWFYKPPENGDLALIASEFDFFIMSKGDEPERDALLALGAKKPILQYIRFEAIMDPGDCTRRPWQNNAAFLPGDFCRISSEHPDWFLLDQDGQRILDTYGDENFWMMDPGNPGWRAFFLERVKQTQEADPNWGGVFLDNVEITLARREQDQKIPSAYPDEASYQAAVQGFLKYLYSGYFQPNGRLLFANLVARRDDADWTQYLTYLDGVMHEGWAIDWPNGYRSAKTWEKHMLLAEQTQAMGKFIVLVSQGTQDNLELQKFAYASYLLINQGRAAFRYANSQFYNEAWFYDNYTLQLGQPLGARYPQGEAWRRDFSHGFVLVNPQTHEVQIHVNG
jgi:hypothetical protein